MATNEVKSAQESAQRPVAELSGNLMKMLEELQRRSPMDIIKNLVGMLKTNAQNPTNKPAENVTPPNPTANQPPQVNAPKQQTTSTPKPEPKTTHTTKPENKSTHTAKPEHKERKAKKQQKKDKSHGSDASWDNQMKLLNATIAMYAKVDKLKEQHDAKHKERQQTQSQQKTQHTTPSPGRR